VNLQLIQHTARPDTRNAPQWRFDSAWTNKRDSFLVVTRLFQKSIAQSNPTNSSTDYLVCCRKQKQRGNIFRDEKISSVQTHNQCQELTMASPEYISLSHTHTHTHTKHTHTQNTHTHTKHTHKHTTHTHTKHTHKHTTHTFVRHKKIHLLQVRNEDFASAT
jgi:hypothetical protein